MERVLYRGQARFFFCFQEAWRSVHRDSYVEVEKAFYEKPPEYIGRQLWVRWDSRCVRASSMSA
jgi:hypothetical protein